MTTLRFSKWPRRKYDRINDVKSNYKRLSTVQKKPQETKSGTGIDTYNSSTPAYHRKRPNSIA